eukprot:jgi/Mesvir1/6466/Mv19541-RA.1
MSNMLRRRANAQRETVAEPDGPARPGAGRRRSRRLFSIWVFVLISVVILTPRAYTLLHLRSGLVRPRVDLSDERQVLIVGTMGSGTNQMSAELGKLGLEVGHETSHSLETYSRDGTISWLHGMRFFTHPSGPNVTLLCAESHKGAFHPSLFGPSQLGCSSYLSWSKCWSFECVRLLLAEHGCDPRTGAARARCASPFRAALLQVRHPLRTVASLVSAAGRDCSNGRHQLMAIGALMPGLIPWEDLEPFIEGRSVNSDGDDVAATTSSSPADGHAPTTGHASHNEDVARLNVSELGERSAEGSAMPVGVGSTGPRSTTRSRIEEDERRRRSCVANFVRYWVAYNKAMLPYVNAWYRVEDTTPCQVAKMGGFLPWPESAVFPPAAETAAAICEGREVGAYWGPGQGERQGYRNRKNVDGLRVTWEDVGAISKELQREMMSLAQKFGYNTTEETVATD